MKTILLRYQGHGVFTTRQKLAFRKNQVLRVAVSQTPITDATFGVIKLPRHLAKRLAHDPDLGGWAG